ncbi:hypothetical protein BGZ67_004144, partial [Mortierella alpina]
MDPSPVHRFIVSDGKQKMAFSKASGLELSFETITYKDGTGSMYQMPGRSRPLNITLERGIVKKASEFLDWINTISKNLVDKRDISISLTDEAGANLLTTWTVTNAFPTKISCLSFDASGEEVAMEELTLVADGLT